MHFLFLPILFRRIKAIRFLMVDKTVRLWKKILIVVGIIYLVFPIGIPIFIPVFGVLDDIILWLCILFILKDELDKYWTGGKDSSIDPKKTYKGKTVIDADFEVKNDNDNDGG